jgi:hypothetical protein
MTNWFWWLVLLVLPACGTEVGADPASKIQYAAESANAELNAVATGSKCDAATDAAAPVFAPPAGAAGSTAVALDDPRLVGWASAVVDIDYGENVDEQWKTPERGLGAAQGTSTDVVSLGEGGAITLGFEQPLVDGAGADFCVFENSFSDTFLELGFVEVASNADTFVRFAAYSRVPAAVEAYGTIESTLVDGFAGKYRQGYCTPFDLALLQDRPEVQRGELDLGAIRYVRIRDVVGDGNDLDCADAPIYDPYPTTGGAGFDLDAVAVLEPAQ